MSVTPPRVRRTCLSATAVTAVALAPVLFSGAAQAAPASVTPPPLHSGFDYQIGGAYTPPSGVRVVSRDHAESPASGLYSICYLNAFQTQPGELGDWSSGLILKDSRGNKVEDPEWKGEYVLDISDPAKRTQIAQKVGSWIDQCAAKGFKAVEPDNYDTFTRFKGLTADNAKAMMSLLVQHAHADGLAIAQKNTIELADDASALGIDFAVVEECGGTSECGDYEDAFGDRVFDIEYTDSGLSEACGGWSDHFSIVRRDEDVSTPGSGGYVRETCDG
ncbi:endo alpha-1,4 polygalactosaminidase [Streptomyces sp. NPDC052040]|uniref:endo alpha-1,4 polygalactosaminidase n=1 Tax=unclassified Streptomyces TaxID=2593676 RepID=UPI0037D2A74A